MALGEADAADERYDELLVGFTDPEKAEVHGLLTCLECNGDDPLTLPAFFCAGGWPALFEEPGLPWPSPARRLN